jgi:hypothetical protein
MRGAAVACHRTLTGGLRNFARALEANVSIITRLKCISTQKKPAETTDLFAAKE